MITESTTRIGIMNLDTRSIPLLYAGINNRQRDQSEDDEAHFGRYAVGNKIGKISVSSNYAAVPHEIFDQILDNPSADNRIIRYDQNRDDGIDPSAKSQPLGFSEGVEGSYRAFPGTCGRSQFQRRSWCNRTLVQGRCKSAGKSPRRISLRDRETSRYFPDLQKPPPQKARIRSSRRRRLRL